MSKDPLDTGVGEGLAKIHEAVEKVTEEQEEALADKARQAAEETRRQYQSKQEAAD